MAAGGLEVEGVVGGEENKSDMIVERKLEGGVESC